MNRRRIDPAAIESTVAAIRASKKIELAGSANRSFSTKRATCSSTAMSCFRQERDTQHPNGLRLTAFDAAGIGTRTSGRFFRSAVDSSSRTARRTDSRKDVDVSPISFSQRGGVC